MNNYMKDLQNIVLKALAGEKVRIFLFGSRARGTRHPGSDVDIGFIPQHPVNPARISALRARIEDSNTPYKVDIVNLLDVSQDFRQNALKDAIVWKN